MRSEGLWPLSTHRRGLASRSVLAALAGLCGAGPRGGEEGRVPTLPQGQALHLSVAPWLHGSVWGLRAGPAHPSPSVGLPWRPQARVSSRLVDSWSAATLLLLSPMGRADGCSLRGISSVPASWAPLAWPPGGRWIGLNLSRTRGRI